jgi:hypothetical protein
VRPVPHLIDRNSRIGEYAMCFMVPLFILRTVGPLLALGVATLVTAAYIKTTLGKPQGHLIHLAYRLGLPLSGLLDPRIRRYIN